MPRPKSIMMLLQVVTTLCIVILVTQTRAAPTSTGDLAELTNKQPETIAATVAKQEPVGNAAATDVATAITATGSSSGPGWAPKVIRDVSSSLRGLDHLDVQETGYLPHPGGYQSTDSDYGYDSGKNAYGKQASDWSLYDQGNHGLYDKYGDKAWADQANQQHSNHGKHDSYGNSYNNAGANHGSGYYSRDRGYGYEKHYAYDKEVASKQHSDNHNSYGANHGLHDYYGNSGSNAHANHGHDRYGQLSRYGNHGYGKKGSNYAANQDYGHNVNRGHYYAQNSQPTSYHQSSGYSQPPVPTYRSTYSDYSPQVGYPSSYPSYY